MKEKAGNILFVRECGLWGHDAMDANSRIYLFVKCFPKHAQSLLGEVLCYMGAVLLQGLENSQFMMTWSLTGK